MSDFWNKPDLLVVSGSKLYGSNRPDSDTDLRGFVVEPAEYLLGRRKFEQYENKVSDTVIWGFNKFFHLLEHGTPNVIELLFAPKESIRACTAIGQRILDSRHLFISSRLVNRFQGFAASEWKKARGVTINKEGQEHFSTRDLGANRKESIEAVGYSSKNAYHAIRLLEEGTELLRTGTITFPRPNAKMLGDMRDRKVLFRDAERIFNNAFQDFHEAVVDTAIPGVPKIKPINELYYDIISDTVSDFFAKRNTHPMSEGSWEEYSTPTPDTDRHRL